MPPRYDQQPPERKKIDARSPVARAAGIRGAKFDSWGNLVGGRYESSGQTGSGRYVQPGDTIAPQDAPAPMSGLDKHAAGMSTPRVNAFSGRSSASAPTPAVVTPGSNDPRLGGSVALDEKTNAMRRNNTREWAGLTRDEKLRREKDPAGAAAALNIQDRQAPPPPRWARPMTPPRQKELTDRAVRATDQRNLAEHGTIAVDPRHAGPGQLTTDIERKNGQAVNVRKGGTPEPRTARFVQGWGNMVKQS